MWEGGGQSSGQLSKLPPVSCKGNFPGVAGLIPHLLVLLCLTAGNMFIQNGCLEMTTSATKSLMSDASTCVLKNINIVFFKGISLLHYVENKIWSCKPSSSNTSFYTSNCFFFSSY